MRLPDHPGRPVRMFLPSDYQPKYAYPLVVLLHADGCAEDDAARLAPRLSRRNYVVACPRGPVSLDRSAAGRPAFAWGRDPHADDHLCGVVAHARSVYHVHPGRLYLIGVGAGAAVAVRLANRLTGAVAGVAALNGELPTARIRGCGLRVFVGHGAGNPEVPAAGVRQAVRGFAAAGADVRFQTYPTTHRVTDDMLRDVNRWIMAGVNTTPGLFPNHDG